MNLPVIKNAAGEKIILNAREAKIAKYWESTISNALGYEVSITTLTTIMRKISEQQFFEVPPADFIPVKVGEGAWSSNLVTYRAYEMGDQFEKGIINTGENNSRLSMADAGVDSVTLQVFNWAKAIGWSIPDLEIAAKSGNWDIVSSKERSRKKNWDLGVQRIAFLGARGNNAAGGTCLGLLNQPGITINTTLITQQIGAMTTAQLKTFVAGLVEAYRANCNRTTWPTHFQIPESDYNSLVSQASPDFPIKSTLELLEEALKLCCRNKNFKVLPLAYGDKAYNSAEINKQCYTLYNSDEENLNMQIPVDYTNTLANSLDNFTFQNAGYGQFTGVQTLRPLTILYFQY